MPLSHFRSIPLPAISNFDVADVNEQLRPLATTAPTCRNCVFGVEFTACLTPLVLSVQRLWVVAPSPRRRRAPSASSMTVLSDTPRPLPGCRAGTGCGTTASAGTPSTATSSTRGRPCGGQTSRPRRLTMGWTGATAAPHPGTNVSSSSSSSTRTRTNIPTHTCTRSRRCSHRVALMPTDRTCGRSGATARAAAPAWLRAAPAAAGAAVFPLPLAVPLRG
jgi:hypothetical protein